MTAHMRNVQLPMMNLVKMRGVSILEQLHLEEKLLRGSSDNWCIINNGAKEPTVVMGVSGKPAELLEVKSVLQNEIPVIRRFTGGGTVIVDDGTVFVTFICNKEAVPNVQPYPQPIMAWSELLYNEVFRGVGDFKLRENDYVLGSRKFGGNAQSITKSRWIHHTSFLWDYDVNNMSHLKVPTRAPKYRMARDHSEFICRMKDYLPRSVFIDRTIEATGAHFSVVSMPREDLQYSPQRPVSPTSKLLAREELEAALLTQDSPTSVCQSQL